MLTTPLSLLSLVLLSTSSYASPLNRLARPTLKVVTNKDGSLDACTPAQVKTLKAALAEGASLATKAASALNKPGAETSDAAKRWLGTIKVATLATQVTKRFTNPAAAFRSTLKPVTKFGTDNAVYFFCPDKKKPKDDPCTLTSDAVTENKLNHSKQNTIALCDRFLNEAATLDEDKKKYEKAVKTGGATTVMFPSPRSKGHILVHEAQHSLPILQSTDTNDNAQDRDGASTPEQTSRLPTSRQKQGSAENWAILAFLAKVAPARLKPSGKSSARLYWQAHGEQLQVLLGNEETAERT